MSMTRRRSRDVDVAWTYARLIGLAIPMPERRSLVAGSWLLPAMATPATRATIARTTMTSIR